MATDGLLNDNREERKLKELKYILYSELRDKLVDVELPVDALWNWIQAYVKEEVERAIKGEYALVNGKVFKRDQNLFKEAMKAIVDNSALVEEVLKVETNDV